MTLSSLFLYFSSKIENENQTMKGNILFFLLRPLSFLLAPSFFIFSGFVLLFNKRSFSVVAFFISGRGSILRVFSHPTGDDMGPYPVTLIPFSVATSQTSF